jgi:hypothetical protein
VDDTSLLWGCVGRKLWRLCEATQLSRALVEVARDGPILRFQRRTVRRGQKLEISTEELASDPLHWDLTSSAGAVLTSNISPDERLSPHGMQHESAVRPVVYMAAGRAAAISIGILIVAVAALIERRLGLGHFC